MRVATNAALFWSLAKEQPVRAKTELTRVHKGQMMRETVESFQNGIVKAHEVVAVHTLLRTWNVEGKLL
jgi:hypothetical protein